MGLLGKYPLGGALIVYGEHDSHTHRYEESVGRHRTPFVVPALDPKVPKSPMRDTLRAMIVQALRDFIYPFERIKVTRTRMNEAVDAFEWLVADTDDFMSFQWICEQLGFNPDPIITRVLEWQTDQKCDRAVELSDSFNTARGVFTKSKAVRNGRLKCRRCLRRGLWVVEGVNYTTYKCVTCGSKLMKRIKRSTVREAA